MKETDVISVMGQLGFARTCIKVGGGWVSAPCPFAQWTHAKGADRSASFGVSVNEDGTSGFNCLSCKESGSLLHLIDSLGDLRKHDYSELRDDVEAKETPDSFPPWEGSVLKVKELPAPMDEEMFDSIFPPAWKVKVARQYFKQRKLFVDSMQHFDLRWDGYRKRILFKVKQEGILYGMSGRSILASAKNKVRVYNHPKSLFLVGEELVDTEDLDRPILVIEGLMGLPELDALNLLDYSDIVALQGSDMSLEQRDRLVELGKPIILLFDQDKAGREGLHGKKLAGGRRKAGAVELLSGLIEVSVARWPADGMDLPDLTCRELEQMVLETWSL
jgi:hypothetical protein